MDAKQLLEMANNLFTKKAPLTSLHQEIADNFYPERAHFTVNRSIGDDFAANLMTSYPVMCRRELGDQFSTMLRPTARPWFHTSIKYSKTLDNDTKQYLEWFNETQRRAMYDPRSLFTRATKEGDHDFAAFGQCVISVEMNRYADGLLYRCWHLRDMCWQEDENGQVCPIFRKWKPTAHTLARLFPGKVDEKVTRLLEKTPFEEVETMHMVVPSEMYDDDAKGRPYFSIWYDVSNAKIIEAVPVWHKIYVIPRWQTVSNSQYSYSPASVAALPEARLIQAMTYTLLEAGEKATSPPLIATQDAVRSDVAVYAGGITWVDNEYDERLGAALRPIEQDLKGFNYGLEMNKNSQAMLHKAFFLDALTLPQRGPDMTAYEVGQRVQEYIRAALPIFEPMEMEYNAAICDMTFDIMRRNGAFGDPRAWPKRLLGAEIDFHFESPLHDALEQQKGQKFQEAQGLISVAVSLDPSCAAVPKAEVALRDALTGIGVPATWMKTEAEVQDALKQQQAQAQQQQTLNAMEQGSNIVKNLGQGQGGGLGRGFTPESANV
jgi:hypothetical protein